MRRRPQRDRPLAVRLITRAMALGAGIAAFVTARRIDEDRRRRRVEGGSAVQPSPSAPAPTATPALVAEPAPAAQAAPAPAAEAAAEAAPAAQAAPAAEPAPPADRTPVTDPGPAAAQRAGRRPGLDRVAVRLVAATVGLGAGIAAVVIAILLVRGVLA